MEKLVQGVQHFQKHLFSEHQELFEHLAMGQSPETLFITCSDSRINPNLITHTKPGELFILRNAGNLVPSFSPYAGGEAATIEYAVVALGVRDIVVCGHSHCGAIWGLFNPSKLTELPSMAAWLKYAEPTWKVIGAKHRNLSGADLVEVAAQENVLVQLQNLRTHPVVAAGLASDQIRLHAWFYRIESGEILVHDSEKGRFVPLTPRVATPA